ncbi:hypothetical protein [Sulfitobacter sp. 1A15106]|uniref:hypothetical protein n=1 Tax=Sulfitobacter sp. 1A15106 TaxID=3368590 RepID=UPI0037462F76
MKNFLIITAFSAVATLLAAQDARSETLGIDSIACTSKENMQTLSQAQAERDIRMINYLVQMNACTILPAGTDFSVVDVMFFSGLAKVRVWAGNTPVTLVTPIENTRARGGLSGQSAQ